MTNLTQASHELFSRPADERFETLSELATHCHNLKDHSHRLKEPSAAFCPEVHDGRMTLCINGHLPFGLNDWSFSQLCGFSKVAKDTVNGYLGVLGSQARRSRNAVDDVRRNAEQVLHQTARDSGPDHAVESLSREIEELRRRIAARRPAVEICQRHIEEQKQLCERIAAGEVSPPVTPGALPSPQLK